MSPIRHSAVYLAIAALLAGPVAAIAGAPADTGTIMMLAGERGACPTPAELARFEHPLPRLARRLAARAPATVVAIGSSSTYGEGASSPAATYPERLARELAQRLSGQRISVLNRGVNGDTDQDARNRFERDVIAERPDVVIWQLGTNSMLNGDALDAHLPVMRDGIRHLRAATGADIVLLDPQYAPHVLNGGPAGELVRMIAQAAGNTGVNVFRRFELMRRWREVKQIAFDTFLSEDEFHMNDWSYACVASALAEALAEGATRTAKPVQVSAR
ncbi:MAG: SGNH/GDSL hydrolase family protein [Xanthobacteraceae bacterium]